MFVLATQNICPVSAADICPVSTADICPVSTEDIYPVSLGAFLEHDDCFHNPKTNFTSQRREQFYQAIPRTEVKTDTAISTSHLLQDSPQRQQGPISQTWHVRKLQCWQRFDCVPPAVADYVEGF